MKRGTLIALLLAAPILPATGSGLPPLVNVCWDYGCDNNARVMVPVSAWQRIERMFSPPAHDPAQERRRIARAIAEFERTLGRLTGTHRDRGGNVAGSGEPGQLDCIDESRNTDAYLRVLAEHDLLAWHSVGERERRMPWIFDQHWTAVVRDRSTDTRWAIDSWYLENGRQPYVQRLEDWLDKAELPANPDASTGARQRDIPRAGWEAPVASR